MKIDRSQFRDGVVATLIVPVVLLALAVIALATWGLRSAAARSDEISVQRQTREVGLALSAAQDELAQNQTGVAIWDPAAAQLRKPKPDWQWVDNNIGSWLSSVYTRECDFILDGSDRPVYGMLARKRVDPIVYRRFTHAISPLVDAVRARNRIAANPHERLPGLPLAPQASLKTSPRAIHATDLVRIGQRVAAVSVMRIISDTKTERSPGTTPLLVSIRFLDAGSMRDLADTKMILGGRLARGDDTRRGERSIPLISSRGQHLGYLAWRPDLPGTRLLRSMAPIAALAVALLIAAVGLLSVRLAKTMRRDARTLKLLHVAHAELQEREAQAQYLAFHDPLTGLPNRALFNQTADRAFENRDPKNPCAILILDLDRFKQVNDTLGHLGGDILLEQVAERLSSLIRPPDFVARLGGDEFAILVRSDASQSGVELLCSDIVARLGAPFELLGTSISIGASVGAALHSDPTLRRSQTMREADLAMYRSKRLSAGKRSPMQDSAGSAVG
jgi:diguanylate cyclase (GGDEF)-like protein